LEKIIKNTNSEEPLKGEDAQHGSMWILSPTRFVSTKGEQWTRC